MLINLINKTLFKKTIAYPKNILITSINTSIMLDQASSKKASH